MTRFKLLLPTLILSGLALLAGPATAKVTETFSRTYALDATGSVSLTNINGSVVIEAWDRNEVSVEAEKSAADTEALGRIRIEIDHAPDHLKIRTEHDRKWKFWGHARSEVRYKLRVPATASLRKIDVVNASIQVRGVRGHVDLETVNGSIKAEGLAAGGRFDTVNGSTTVSFAAVGAADRIHLNTVNGSCTLELPVESAFSLKAGTVNGRVSCDFPITLEQSGRRSLRGTVNGGGATVVLDAVNGTLRVRAAK